MDWKLTKTYMIIFLLILNIILFCANFLSKNEYKLSNLQENSIISFTEKNNIKISTKIPKKFYPMNSISMKKIEYNNFTLLDIFFGTDKENIIMTDNLGTTILKKDFKTLYINNSFVKFEDTEINENFKFEEKYILNEIETFKDKISKEYGKMKVDKIIKTQNYYSINYIEYINKFKNFNNYLNITIFKDGTKTINFNYYQKIDYSNEIKEICSPDEAIYIFSKEIRNIFETEPIEITKIDLGYYIENSKNNYEYISKPYYRFYINNSDTPFFVNAYTNTFEISSPPLIID